MGVLWFVKSHIHREAATDGLVDDLVYTSR